MTSVAGREECGLNPPRIARCSGAAAHLVRALARCGSMARGILSVEEAQAAAVLDHHRKAVETFDLERRIAAIEATHR